MNDIKQISFNFSDFKVISFSLDSFASKPDDELALQFGPSGSFDGTNYVVKFDFRAFVKEESEERDFINATMVSRFIFDESITFENIPNYFFPNSIAIAFPYLRAFISTLTVQANIQPLILPTMNLMDLAGPLKQNTVQLSDIDK